MLDYAINTMPGVVDDITQTIGNTPLIRLSKFAASQHVEATLLAKVEFFNPAGSIKDRPAMAMLNALMASSAFNEKTEIIEASSGNNGVACAWLCAIYGIKLTVCIPEHMSVERQKLIRHYGAQVVTTPKELGTKGAIEQAAALIEQNPNAVGLSQFSNQANPDAHAKSTAQEILRDTSGNVDIVVAGVGTGGTLTGLATSMRAHIPHLEIVAVEPASCPVLSKGHGGVHNIQGLSSGHVPDVLDVSQINQIITVEDNEAIAYAQQVARVEGLAVGISSGAALFAAAQLAQQSSNKGKNIVIILADGAERYFSTPLFAN
ncbi:cysteine synthase A [Alteromonas sp. MMG017]|uniref:cysteine synthase A n=1 Tax=Alteromonas sp. MMG017 TaxID=2822692 RepID=UPI001B3A522C|nr:cysteine synthase A [Alteromonas sp. MMG017]MBQ4831236.1 cysteine synthase A [Alteromonas sp. MMG017]